MKTHVLLCSHNGECYIAQQLQSILEQSEPIDCIHVFDFGSADSTVEIVRRIQAEHPKIALHTSPDAPGASLSFFTAMQRLAPQLADDDLVYLSDQDDVWLPGKSSTCLAAFQQLLPEAKNQCLLLFHDVRVVDASLQPLQERFYTGSPYAVPRDLTAMRILLCNPIIGHTMAMSARLIKITAATVQPHAYLMHDWAITLVAMHCADIHYLEHRPYSLYRQHSHNVLGIARKHRIYEKIQRTRIFSQKIIVQTIAFSQDAEKLEKQGWLFSHPYPRLQKIIHQQHFWQLPFFLSHIAFTTGPTLKRKLLGFFVLFSKYKKIPTNRN